MHALAILAAIAVSAGPPPDGSRFDAFPADGGVRIHVSKRGLFAAFAHDHDFEVTRWRGTAEIPEGDPGRASLEVVLEADSLRDREKGLSDGDRRRVEAQAAGPDVLDAVRAPEIVYRSDGVTLDARSGAENGPVRGTIHGRLKLKGTTRPVDATFEAERAAGSWRVGGRARFRQSEFGIRPFSGFGGAVGVRDEIEVAFALVLRPDHAVQAAAPAP